MENPFENGHIKNYILLYGSVVVIMILFFIATTLFHGEEKKIEQKTFNTEINATQKKQAMQKEEVAHAAKPKFKLLKKGY
jgi:hypothetical protein